MCLGQLNIHTLLHDDPSNNFLADEVSDLHLPQASLLVLVQVDVDGEMGVDVSHLVLEALGHTDNHVRDDRSNGSQRGNVLTVAMVDLDRDGVLLGVAEVDSQVAEVLDQLAPGTLDGDDSGLDGDLDCTRDCR